MRITKRQNHTAVLVIWISVQEWPLRVACQVLPFVLWIYPHHYFREQRSIECCYTQWVGRLLPSQIKSFLMKGRLNIIPWWFFNYDLFVDCRPSLPWTKCWGKQQLSCLQEFAYTMGDPIPEKATILHGPDELHGYAWHLLLSSFLWIFAAGFNTSGNTGEETSAVVGGSETFKCSAVHISFSLGGARRTCEV